MCFFLLYLINVYQQYTYIQLLQISKNLNFSFFFHLFLFGGGEKLDFYIPQRYWLTFMGFFGLVMAYSLRLSLSVAITQMVPPPIFSTANLTNAHGEMEIVCPFNDSNYIHEHFDYVAIFDSLYSVKKKFNQFYYYYHCCLFFLIRHREMKNHILHPKQEEREIIQLICKVLRYYI